MRKLTSVLFLFLLIVSSSFTHTRSKEKAKINWITLEEAESLMKENPKKILIDIYTTWCAPCREMEYTTYQDQRVIQFINENYYAVKLDAEGYREVQFRGHTFKNQNKVHQLTKQFGVQSYPSTVFIDTDLSLISTVPGFWKAKDFEVILNFFDGDHYKNIAFDTYKDNYKRR